MSQELLSDADIESLTTEFGERVDFNTVELQGFRGMIRKAANAADVTKEKVKRALLTNKHDPHRNYGVDNAKQKSADEHFYQYDKRQLKHEDRKEKEELRNTRRDAAQESALKFRDVKDQRDQRTDNRKLRRDTERERVYGNSRYATIQSGRYGHGGGPVQHGNRENHAMQSGRPGHANYTKAEQNHTPSGDEGQGHFQQQGRDKIKSDPDGQDDHTMNKQQGELDYYNEKRDKQRSTPYVNFIKDNVYLV